jgi:membrane associated rhomboid family serine protease
MSGNSSDWTFYLTGFVLLLLGIAFILVPLLGRSGALSNVKIPWFILYTYNKGGVFFATSPILILISLVGFLVALLRR